MAKGLFGVGHDLQARLIEKVETGMGYQFLQLSKRDFVLVISSVYVVQFGTRAELFDGLRKLQDRLTQHRLDWRGLAPAGALTSAPPYLDEWPFHAELSFGEVVTREDPRAINYLKSGPQRRATSKSVELVHEVPAGEFRMFFRFCAVNSDRRIREDGSFAAGTYATTFNDLRMVPSGLAAVGRYALPIPESARFVRSITTDAEHRMGTALSHFSQAGGGVEVLFDQEAKAALNRGHQIDPG